MIIASIDLQGGQTVQLVGGAEKAIDAGDPTPIAERFALAGEIAVIDLDAAMGKGSNAALIEALLPRFAVRVGGGIRDLATAVSWLDKGARKVILGTAAQPHLLSQLPRDRVIAALDARHGEVVVEGWQQGTGRGILERIAELKAHVGGFLVTFVELEGRMGGTNLELAKAVVEAAGKDCKVTIAGGVTTAEEIAALDRIGADAQVGMALYTGRLDLADAIIAPLVTDRPDGLYPTVVVDERGICLGLVYSSKESIREAVRLQEALPYTEPPAWYLPEREVLGHALLRAGQPAEAEAVYRAQLVLTPRNGWSLLGLAESLRAQGRNEAAAAVEEQRAAAWQLADVTPPGSVF